MTPQHTTTAAAIDAAMQQLKELLPPDLECWVTIARLNPTEKAYEVVGDIETAEEFLEWMKEGDRTND